MTYALAGNSHANWLISGLKLELKGNSPYNLSDFSRITVNRKN